MGRTADRQQAAELVFNRLLQILLYTVQFHRRKKLAIRKHVIIFNLTAYADELLYIIIPWRNIFIPNGPVDCDPVFRICLKVMVAEPVALTPLPNPLGKRLEIEFIKMKVDPNVEAQRKITLA